MSSPTPTTDSTVQRLSVSQQAVSRIIQAGVAAAMSTGFTGSIAVVDDSGQLLGFQRLDGASVSSIELAIDKAYTVVSIGFGLSTADLFTAIKDDKPIVTGIAARGRNLFVGGGVPIKKDGAVIGAIGVSGGHYTEDMKVAEAALAAF